jgi:hypothetical protein
LAQDDCSFPPARFVLQIRQVGVFGKAAVRSCRPLEHHSGFRHGCADHLGIVGLFGGILVEKVAAGAPGF